MGLLLNVNRLLSEVAIAGRADALAVTAKIVANKLLTENPLENLLNTECT
ncbi:hypothetical protein [Pseudanabaena sp. ABRG5-3]|nr:hypothetical protein [Pseudanabaena sp. ABRG5-3]